MAYLEICGRKLRYETEGEGRSLLFLHGLGGSIQQIRGLYDPIQGVKLIAPDQQGHGESAPDWEQYDFDHLADDMAVLLHTLGERKAVVAGVSMGAAVALNLAVRYPELIDRLVLIRNAWTWEAFSEDRQKAYRDLGISLERFRQEKQKGQNDQTGRDGCDVGWEKWADAFRNTPGGRIIEGTGSAYTKGAFRQPFREDFNIIWNRKFQILPGLSPIASPDEAAAVRAETLIIACRGDYCHPYERGEDLREQIPGAKMVEIPSKDEDGKRHRALINSSLRGFLQES